MGDRLRTRADGGLGPLASGRRVVAGHASVRADHDRATGGTVRAGQNVTDAGKNGRKPVLAERAGSISQTSDDAKPSRRQRLNRRPGAEGGGLSGNGDWYMQPGAAGLGAEGGGLSGDGNGGGLRFNVSCGAGDGRVDGQCYAAASARSTAAGSRSSTLRNSRAARSG
jgi:hypothetical protein